MIVEDSLVVRNLLAHIIARDPRLMVAAAVASGEEALREIGRVRPDVVSMDIRLPGIDGFETTARIMSEAPTPIVVIADAIEDSLKISMNALKAGALSVVEKPRGLANADYEGVSRTICDQLYIMSDVSVIRRRMQRPVRAATQGDVASAETPAVLAIAASTGGPPALAKVLGDLPPDFPVPILLVQHMGAPFMEGFAAWLNTQVALDVRLARHSEVLAPGRVYVAPGDRHLTLGPQGMAMMTQDAPIMSQRPSANTLFDSVARNAGPRGLGVLLTGMGEDGATGLLAMRQAGGNTIAEDESTCVVFGMPGAAVKIGAARAILPLDMIGQRIMQILKAGVR